MSWHRIPVARCTAADMSRGGVRCDQLAIYADGEGGYRCNLHEPEGGR